MSVERANELLNRLASDSELCSQIENASTSDAKRQVVNNAGYADVSGQDMAQAVQEAQAGATPSSEQQRAQNCALVGTDGKEFMPGS